MRGTYQGREGLSRQSKKNILPEHIPIIAHAHTKDLEEEESTGRESSDGAVDDAVVPDDLQSMIDKETVGDANKQVTEGVEEEWQRGRGDPCEEGCAR